jgi:hypothetical protein
MIEFIIDIWSNVVDLYQQFFGIPEGVTYALFGSRKRKRAKKKMEALQNDGIDIPEVEVEVQANKDIAASNPQVEGKPDASEETLTKENTLKEPSTTYKPEFPYRGNQIIIDSDRVLINSKQDSTFIIGKKAVGISTNGTFNINSGGKTIINSSEIMLGLEAKHPLIKGDSLAIIFVEFLKILDQEVCENLKLASDVNDVPIKFTQRAGVSLQKATRALAKRIPGTLSELVKTQ